MLELILRNMTHHEILLPPSHKHLPIWHHSARQRPSSRATFVLPPPTSTAVAKGAFTLTFPICASTPSPSRRHRLLCQAPQKAPQNADLGGIDTLPSPFCRMVHDPEKRSQNPPFPPGNSEILADLGKPSPQTPLYSLCSQTATIQLAGFRNSTKYSSNPQKMPINIYIYTFQEFVGISNPLILDDSGPFLDFLVGLRKMSHHRPLEGTEPHQVLSASWVITIWKTVWPRSSKDFPLSSCPYVAFLCFPLVTASHRDRLYLDRQSSSDQALLHTPTTGNPSRYTKILWRIRDSNGL